MQWKTLSSPEQLKSIIEQSHVQPSIIFKHSTTCPISSMAKMRIEDKWESLQEATTFYYLDLLTYRPLSNQIATALGIDHESPQLILLKNGSAIYNASHFDINIDSVQQSLANENI